MDMVVCPHCKAHPLFGNKISKDMIVFASCPSCQELAVVFRERVVALNRRIIESGSFDEKKDHLAEVIAHFLEAGFSFLGESEELADTPFGQLFSRQGAAGTQHQPQQNLITEDEIDRFTRIELKRLDNPAYFKRHFG